MSRPEHLAPPEEFYNADEAKKYAVNSRMREIQTSLTERALELLALPGQDMLLLDVGCGSGLSGECITEAGHQWIGCDISRDMLQQAKEQEVEGDVVVNDMGQVSGAREAPRLASPSDAPPRHHRAFRSARGRLMAVSPFQRCSGCATPTGATPTPTGGSSPFSPRCTAASSVAAAPSCSGTQRTRNRWSWSPRAPCGVAFRVGCWWTTRTRHARRSTS